MISVLGTKKTFLVQLSNKVALYCKSAAFGFTEATKTKKGTV